MSKKVILVILDGWGNGKKNKADAIFHAHTPNFDKLISEYPNALLRTDGENVGLPEGQMGNSEVGHLNIGAGRVVYQELLKINRSIEQGNFYQKKALIEAFEHAKSRQKKVHFLGLVSEGGIHSHQNHLVALCKLANDLGVTESYIHAFTDGRDTDPKSGIDYIKKLTRDISSTPTKIASVIGRYYAMDRDLRWERIKKAYDLIVHGKGEAYQNVIEGIESSYIEGITDEFIEPIVTVDRKGKSIANISEDDVVIFFNFRTDRCRQLCRAIHQENIEEAGMKKLPLKVFTMTEYDKSFRDISIVFEKDDLKNTLGEVICESGKIQIRTAETEKYPHVTFFFSGGREEAFQGEKRILVSSPKVATYDLQPEMSADEVTDKLIPEINSAEADFICLNYANPDMVGHTGDYNAITKAVEKVDHCLGRIVEAGLESNYSMIITADHGNADNALNADGSPNTAHSLNPVPIIIIDPEIQQIKNGILANIAPTILKIMGISIPTEMNTDVLF